MGQDPGHGAKRTRNKKRLAIVLGLTGSYLAAEVVGGLLTKSLALLADAGHMLTDVGGLALALFAIRFAEKPASPEKTYGYYRFEILAALANAVVLIGVSLYVVYEAVQRFRSPPEIDSRGMLAVAAVGLVVNVVGAVILAKGSDESLNMKGAYFEVLSDLLTSVAVLIGGAVIWLTGYTRLDAIISAAIGLFILPRTWKLLREAVEVLLEATPADVNLAALREAMKGVAGVTDVHDLHVWALTSGMNAMSAHVVVGQDAYYADVLRDVRTHVLKNFKIHHVTIQAEPRGCEAHETHL